MSNANGAGVTKRCLRAQERQVLADIGYTLMPTYGNNAIVAGSYASYGSSPSASFDVGGVNDGVDAAGNLSYVAIVGGSNVIPTSELTGLLTNDRAAASFEGLEDLTDPNALFIPASGTNGTSINYISNVPGMHLVRYVPVNAANQRGNITYACVYVVATGTPAWGCEMVRNGNFETYSSLPTSPGLSKNVPGGHLPA
ncbi:hypothetical protein [Flavobacterium sp. 3HN19-14]|uniref:hypothetical protein n=1 Tax=Flavobacterium sp. 3HN19-14 TaxID=3448133 RepID=UPI003EE3081F